MEEGLDYVGEIIVPNFSDDIPKLNARHKFQQVEPIFLWKLTENLIVKLSHFNVKYGKKLTLSFHELPR
jgi:hypothetical protein